MSLTGNSRTTFRRAMLFWVIFGIMVSATMAVSNSQESRKKIETAASAEPTRQAPRTLVTHLPDRDRRVRVEAYLTLIHVQEDCFPGPVRQKIGKSGLNTWKTENADEMTSNSWQ